MGAYKLIEKENKGQFIVTIVGDINDGDYVTTIESYSKERFEKHILDELNDLKANASDEYELETYCNDWLSIPSDTQGSCHSLVEVIVEYIDNDGKIWNVEVTG